MFVQTRRQCYCPNMVDTTMTDMDDTTDQPRVLLDDWDHEIDFEHPFVGRERELNLLLDALTKRYRLFGVFGIRSVGKSRLVKELLRRYAASFEQCDNLHDQSLASVEDSKDANGPPTVIRLDLERQTDISGVYANLFASIGESPKATDTNDKAWLLQIIRYVKDRKANRFVFFFDNVEHADENGPLADGLKSLFLQLTSNCVNVRVLITSTTKFMTSKLNRVYFCHELAPLRPTESAELLRVIAPEVDLGEYEDVIVKLSEGLPLLLSMIANELADDDGMITPKEMAELLATSRLECLSRREFYAEEDGIADVYKKFIGRLHDVYRRRLAVLGYIPGSFDVREAKELLGLPTDAQTKDQALIPIRRRFMLTYDPETGRFNIQGILRECLDVFFAIKNITDVRKKFCRVFSTVMTEISEQLGTTESVRAMAQFSQEQPNFQKLMTEVYYTTEDSYRFFITMATRCTDLIERFLLKECDEFYNGCLQMSGQYGNDLDTAMVNIAVGSMWTNAKGNLKKGEISYEGAMKVLITKGSRLQQATIYQRYGWNLLSQGKSADAVRYFQKSLNISDSGGPEFHRLRQQSLNSLGIANTRLGRYADAERYHFTSLRRAKTTLTEDHPQLGFIFNNIGVFYGAQGDSQNALKYYLQGLKNKKKNKAPENSILLSHSNVACEYSALKIYDKANELIDEAIDILLKREVPGKYVLSIMYDTKGKVLIAQKRYEEALAVLAKAVDMRESVEPEGINYVESLMHMAVAQQGVDEYASCIKTAKKVMKLKDKVKKTMPHNTFVSECYECLLEVYRKMGNDEKHLETLEGLETELCRLEDVHICACNESSVEKVRKKLVQIRDKIDMYRQRGPRQAET